MHILQQLLFIIAAGLAGSMVYRRAISIRRTIRLGRDESLRDQPSRRLKTMLRIAFAQKKMFDRPVAGFLHLLVYAGFLLINVEVLEIVLDGLLGTHRLFAPALGGFYPMLISFYEVLALGVIVACAIFLVRRARGGVNRLQPSSNRELKEWPARDGKLILTFEIVLMSAVLLMNAADLALQERAGTDYPATGNFLISGWIKPLLLDWSTSSLVVLERSAWWIHILGIMGFAVYITYSKHLHIVLAFPNTYFTRFAPKGEMKSMPEITREVARFGAKDVTDLSWKNLLDAYACTECGRCTSACPAHLTGKLLSPRKIMMDTRDRLEEVGKVMEGNGGAFKEDGKSLLGDYIQAEELLACTTCNACVEECPILINPLDIILQLRRYRVMEEAQAPAAWNTMFQNLETNQAPWKFSPAERLKWTEAVKSSGEV
jgi:heterodisulfide reductase subunit C